MCERVNLRIWSLLASIVGWTDRLKSERVQVKHCGACWTGGLGFRLSRLAQLESVSNTIFGARKKTLLGSRKKAGISKSICVKRPDCEVLFVFIECRKSASFRLLEQRWALVCAERMSFRHFSYLAHIREGRFGDVWSECNCEKMKLFWNFCLTIHRKALKSCE